MLSFSQSIKYAREVVNTLCDSHMDGRGYVKKGDLRAAQFVASEFKKAMLKKYSENYFQNFTLSVNTFPGKMDVRMDNQYLIPGQDYLIDPGSPGVSGTFLTISLRVDEMLNDSVWNAKVKSATDKFIIVEAYDKNTLRTDENKKVKDVIRFLQYTPQPLARGIIVITDDKLTWSGSTVLYNRPTLFLKTGIVKKPINRIELDIENKFISSYKTQNVIGYLEGDHTDSLLVYTAHYDHLGMMGKSTMFPGANDNASGVAMMLSLMQYYMKHKPKYSTVFMAFGAEELGLLGSKYFIEHPLFSLASIKFLMNFDMAGTGDEGIQVVNGKIYKQKFDLMTQINKDFNLVAQVKIRGEACNSDHCMFYSKGVPSFFIYTIGGIQAYHDIYDKSQTLPFTDFEDYFKLMVEFIKQL